MRLEFDLEYWLEIGDLPVADGGTPVYAAPSSTTSAATAPAAATATCSNRIRASRATGPGFRMRADRWWTRVDAR
jgi:hypothetical protein